MRAAVADICDINPRLDAKPADDEPVAFVRMADLNEVEAVATDPEVRPYAEVAKGYTPFVDGDLLVAKITPCFQNNKIGQARTSTRLAFGSTEFHVLRPHGDVADRRYLLHLLRHRDVLRHGEMRMTGAGGQRRVPARFFEELTVPLPPLEEQRRIASMLDAADVLRAKRREALAKLDSLTQAIFVDMFGDPVGNGRGWPVSELGSVCERVQIGPFGSKLHQSDYVTGGIPLVNPMHIVDGAIEPDEGQSVAPEKYGELESYLLGVGDVVMGRRGEMGRVAIVRKDEAGYVCGSGSLFMRPNPERLRPSYLAAVLSSPQGRRRLEQSAQGVTMPNLNASIMGSFSLAVPPLEFQVDFETSLASQSRLADSADEHMRALDGLFASLQQRAFRGEL